MYCKKCKYHAFDHVNTCPKCGADWEETRKALYLNWLTSRGHDWFAASAPQVQPPSGAATIPSRADQPELQEEYLNLETTAARSEEIEVSLLPDLDFGLEEPAPSKPAPVTAKTPTPPRPAPATQELFLDDKAIEDMVELDFSLSLDTPAPIAPKPSAPKPMTSKATLPKRDELFIPELEEMLAPLTEEPKTPASAKTAKKFSGEDDIFLDFSKETRPAPAKPDIAELDLLDFDTKK